MNISSRCEYGCRAMLGLAKHHASQQPVASVTLAEQWHIPKKYLVHIMLQLKHAGLVRSIRGAQGGYVLACPPEQITLLDMVQAIDGPVMERLPVDDARSEVLNAAWLDVSHKVADVLRGCTLRQLMDSAATSDMYYI